MNILHKREPMPRRTFLKAAGVSLALPWLDVMSASANSIGTAGSITAAETPRRAVFCFFGLGINGRDFTPADTGRNYTLTPILRPLAALKDDFTVVSGLKLTHSGGHVGDRTFLTGTNTRSAGARLRVSCDQELAAAVGRNTRFPSLSLGIKRGTGFGGYYDHTLSWSPSGTPIPAENRPHVLFDQLFRPDTPQTITQREAEFVRRASVLDSLRHEARRLEGSLGADDRHKLDEYLTGIRDLERRMQEERDWLRRPSRRWTPSTSATFRASTPTGPGWNIAAINGSCSTSSPLPCRPTAPASSPTWPAWTAPTAPAPGASLGNPYNYHEMTHHGEDPDKLQWFTRADTWYMEEWAYFLGKLKSVKRRRRYAARSHSGIVRQQRRSHQRPPQPPPAHHAGRRCPPGRPPSGPRRQGRRPPRQPLAHRLRTHERARTQGFSGRRGGRRHSRTGLIDFNGTSSLIADNDPRSRPKALRTM